jgi:phosphate acetyltransferase
MGRSLYIASVEPRSGKTMVALGVMESLSRQIRKLGFFRPSTSDPDQDTSIQMMRKRYNLPFDPGSMSALTSHRTRELAVMGQIEDLRKDIFDAYKALESQCQFVVCEGTDFVSMASAFEFDFNADIANNLGCPVMLVINGRRKAGDEVVDAVRVSQESFLDKGCVIAATIVNRVDPEALTLINEVLKAQDNVLKPVFVLPEDPLLGKPTVGEIAKALNARVIQGKPEAMNREIYDLKVAAMKVPNFLDHIGEGSLIITPGDRADIIVAGMAASFSTSYPQIAGLLLTGGLEPEAQITRLIEGIEPFSQPVLCVKTDTFETAVNASGVKAALSAENDRKIATALGIFERYVDLPMLEKRIEVVRSERRTPIMFEYELIQRAKADRKHIVLPEGEEERILRASEILLKRSVADITLLGNAETIKTKIAQLGLNLESARIVDPDYAEWIKAYAEAYFEMRKHKGMTLDHAFDNMLDVSYFGTMMVHMGDADGMVSGAVHTTGDTIRPAFEIIRTKPGISVVSSAFLMCLSDRVLVYGDCAVNPNPTAEQLADIAISSADTARTYGIDPRVAMCSYSTGTSGKGADVDKVQRATVIAKEQRPDLKIEGPIQYDAAVDAGVARTKLPESEVAGNATVFIFPDLNTGNNLYKAVQRTANAVAVGPVMQGLNKPVNDLSRGCTVTDIVNTVAITAIQAQA